MKIGVTGAAGFLGWHVRAWLRTHRPDLEVRTADRRTFANAGMLKAFCSGLDAIIHCAGMNRGDDAEVESVNVELAKSLAAACRSPADTSGDFPRIVFANSAHVDRVSAYASGKRAAAEILSAASGNPAGFSNVILPNLFGEFGRPFYNSVVATFCHQLVSGEKPLVHHDSTLELLHAQKAAQLLADAATGGHGGEIRPVGEPVTLNALLEKLTAMHASYNVANIVPDCQDPLDRELFNTLRSYGFPEQSRAPLNLNRDPRGELFETIKAGGGGQTFVSATHPGITRGNHYHTYKFERFVVCSGQAAISLRRLFASEVVTFQVSGDEPCAIDMPTFCAHNITNTGSTPLVTLFWANEIFDPEKPDTYREEVNV